MKRRLISADFLAGLALAAVFTSCNRPKVIEEPPQTKIQFSETAIVGLREHHPEGASVKVPSEPTKPPVVEIPKVERYPVPGVILA